MRACVFVFLALTGHPLLLLLQAQSHRWELYRGTHPDLLSWGLRWSMIKQEVEDLTPDLVCMQVRAAGMHRLWVLEPS